VETAGLVVERGRVAVRDGAAGELATAIREAALVAMLERAALIRAVLAVERAGLPVREPCRQTLVVVGGDRVQRGGKYSQRTGRERKSAEMAAFTA
jgi:hypothetical protein